MKIKLNNGFEIPSIGIGTWEITGHKAKESVLNALECGYKLIDTATIYRNEEQVGEAIEESGVDRDGIFVTTKIWNSDHGDVVGAFNRSLDSLKLEYVDLYLIHWPPEFGVHVDTWNIMNQLMLEGRTKSIGVSNYNIKQLEELIKKSGIVPSVNQVPISPFSVNTQFFHISHNRELINYCNEKGIVVEAYSPLTRGIELKNPALLKIAQKYDKTAAQILLRWGLQRGLVVIPKSQNKERINENFDVFDFEMHDSDMEILNSF
jgi:diketogulonate reductase-like aldo/keto reductase